jgi:hypothetical protein
MIGKPGPPGGPRLSRQLEAEGRRNREDAEALASALGDWVPAKGEEQ